MQRMCTMCGQVKDETEFKIKTYKNSPRKLHRSYYCNNCQRLYNKEYMRIYRERRKDENRNKI